MEVKADHGPADIEALDQDAADELIRGQACQRRVEGQDDRAVEPGRSEQPEFGALVGQAEQRLRGIEQGARMRLEGQRRRRLAEAFGAIQRGGDHRLVAAMDPVEIAHGDDGAAQRASGRIVAHDEKAFRRHRVQLVKKTFGAVGAVATDTSQGEETQKLCDAKAGN